MEKTSTILENGMLSEEMFMQGMAILMSHFPCLQAEKNRLTTTFEFLKDLTDDEFSTGIKEFCKNQKEIFPNTNIAAYIREFSGKKEIKSLHMGPEEAWGIALKAANENESVVWTDEIAEAFGASYQQVKARDTVGGRMAFLEKYRQLIKERANEPPRWWATLGFDKEDRDEAEKKALQLNNDIRLLLDSSKQKMLS